MRPTSGSLAACTARVVRDRAGVWAELAARLGQEMREGLWEALETTLRQFPETMVDLPSPNWKWASLKKTYLEQ